jgi:hypothetical protein
MLPARRRGQGGAPHCLTDLDRAEHRHIIGGGGTGLTTRAPAARVTGPDRTGSQIAVPVA